MHGRDRRVTRVCCCTLRWGWSEYVVVRWRVVFGMRVKRSIEREPRGLLCIRGKDVDENRYKLTVRVYTIPWPVLDPPVLDYWFCFVAFPSSSVHGAAGGAAVGGDDSCYCCG